MVHALLTANRATNERQLQKLAKRKIDKAEHLLSSFEATKALELIANELLSKQTISGRAVRHFEKLAEQQ